MRNSEHTFKSADGADIFYRRFLPDGETKAVLQIFHGMAEHSARYADFANDLIDNGIAVYVSDHRGHGKTITDMKDYGVWQHRDEWWRIVADLKQLKDIATAENPNVPYFVLGHSMGSFLAPTIQHSKSAARICLRTFRIRLIILMNRLPIRRLLRLTLPIPTGF